MVKDASSTKVAAGVPVIKYEFLSGKRREDFLKNSYIKFYFILLVTCG